MPVTVERTEYGLSEHAVNALVGGVSALGFPVTRLDADSILRAATRRCGLHDLGDERYLQGLHKVIDDAKGRFTHFGDALMRKLLIEAAVNRLKVEDYIKRHPEVLEVKVERPLFVLGFPRTGTTLLQNLLPQHPSRRALPFWEMYNPAPGDTTRERDRERKRKHLGRVLDIAHFFGPEMRAIHDVRPDTPEECWQLFTNTCRVLNYDLVFGLTNYGDWLLDSDMTWAYREYRRSLQMLLHQWPAEQLVLKCPEHLWFLDALLDVFPDACVVQTHRDPMACIASYCSMVSINRRMFYGHIDHTTIGEQITRRFHMGVQRAYQVRSAHPRPHQFYDVRFHDLVSSPTAGVRGITEHFGLPHVSDEAVQTWLRSNRKDKRGAHKYTAEMYGLKRGRVYERYSNYIDWAGVNVAA